jgi:photosystem II stability/assembly factor-like uncharacterized protein
MSHRTIRRAVHPALLGLAVVGLVLVSSPASVPARENSRDEEIAKIKQQIAELQQKLAAIEKTPAPAPAGDPTKRIAAGTLPDEWVKALNWRCIGPASMGGRIVALAVYDADPTTYWIGTASGGLLKTVNNGVTFEHQFDREATVSIGDVAVAPSDRNILWVGTGENNPRNSVSYGDGVYKSTDGGKKWKNMGLKKTFQIGRVVIHPKNPDIVYVGALGRLYGPNEERGLYKTMDGGNTWTKMQLPVDSNTGVIDIQMNPADPEMLLVATWERRRDGFDSHAGAIAAQRTPNTKVDPPLVDGYDAYDPIKKWGKGGGIFKTSDGGKSFKKLTQGLPTCATGRIGMDWYRRDPKVVFAIIDTEKIGQGVVPGYLGVSSDDAPNAGGAIITQVTPNSPAAAAGLKAKDIIVAINKAGIKKYDDFVGLIQKTKPGDKISIDLVRDGKPLNLSITLGERMPVMAGPGGRAGGFLFRSEEVPGGVRVTAMTPEGPAARAGILVGDVIVAVGKEKVTRAQQILEAIRNAQPGSKVALRIARGGETKDLAFVVPPRTVGSPQRTRPYSALYGGQAPNIQDTQGPDSREYGGVYRSDDAGETWRRINSVNPRPMYFSQVRVDPSNDKLLYVLGVRMYRSTDGGKTFAAGGDNAVHADQHVLWINPRDGRHLIIGTDGGTYASYDRGERWDYLNTKSVGQFYHVAVDTRRPYRVYGGMQDNGSWGGPSHTLDGRGPLNADWVMVQGGDGFVCRVDPSDPDIVYAESQEGNMTRTNLRTGQRAMIKPRAPQGQKPYRFNWNAPMILSSHNPSIFFCGGNYVFRSYKRGDDPRPISPELTMTDQGSATALAESPRNPDILWAGTDDGNLWVTRDGGAKWSNVTARVGLPKPFWVSTIEPSNQVDGRCYVCFDAHRSDNDEPWIYVTEDHGETWKSIRGNLPSGSSRCLREDLFNPDVLYLGTEFAAWSSIDRGASWTRINNNLPTVAIHEFAQHPTAGEMVVATHGRSLWVVDVTPLRQLTPAMVKAPATLLAPNTAIRWRRELTRGTIYGMGHRDYVGENPRPGAQIFYALTQKANKVSLTVQDYAGKTLTTLPVQTGPGLHRVEWNLIGAAPTGVGLVRQPGVPRIQGAQRGQGGQGGGARAQRGQGGQGGQAAQRGQGGQGAQRGQGGQGGQRFQRGQGMMMAGGRFAPPGQYRIVLNVDGKEFVQGLRIENDPTRPADALIAEEQPAEPKRANRQDH